MANCRYEYYFNNYTYEFVKQNQKKVEIRSKKFALFLP